MSEPALSVVVPAFLGGTANRARNPSISMRLVAAGWSFLILAGPVTSIPLLLFGFSARRVPLSMLGFIQYIAPTLQFLLGVFVYQEPFPPARLVGFSIIWAALLIYTLEGVFHSRRQKSGRALIDPS